MPKKSQGEERMTTKKTAMRCTTHHSACDCREYRFQQMESALKVIRTWAAFDLDNNFAMKTLNGIAVISLCDRALNDEPNN